MKLNLDYLDVLYDWKAKADTELEKFQEKYKDYTWNEDEPEEKIIYNIRLSNLLKNSNRCKNAIRVYIAHHSN